MENNGLKESLLGARQERRAYLAFNYYNTETLKGVLQAAGERKMPVILQLTRSSIEYLGLEVAVRLGRAGLSQYGVTGWIHLDHGDSVELVKRCLDAGFDSVMIDASEKPLDENIRISARVARMAEPYRVNVEAELGYVAKLGQSSEKTGFTEPAEAKRFTEETGVNALAVAIGTSHGFYKSEPRLDLERLRAIREIVSTPLVLHGASGIPPEHLREAISLGVCKINIATEIKNMFMRTLKQCLTGSEEIDLRRMFPPAIESVKTLVSEKYRQIIE